MTKQETIQELARLLGVPTDDICGRLEAGLIRDLETWTQDDVYSYVRACEWADPRVKHTAIIGKQGVQE